MINYVSTKREYLRDYVKSLNKQHEEDIVFNKEIIGKRIYCEDKGVPLEIDCYYQLNNLFIVRTNDVSYVPKKGLVKVSDLYDHSNILSGNIKVTGFTLEGTDGIGKSTAIESLLNEGIVCYDRNLDVICKYMLLDVPMETRISAYRKFLETTREKILFLVNMDSEELQRRINLRSSISEFDHQAVLYNQMYFDTYNRMRELGYLNGKLFMLDCTGLSPEDEKEQIKKMVLR